MLWETGQSEWEQIICKGFYFFPIGSERLLQWFWNVVVSRGSTLTFLTAFRKVQKTAIDVYLGLGKALWFLTVGVHLAFARARIIDW